MQLLLCCGHLLCLLQQLLSRFAVVLMVLRVRPGPADGSDPCLLPMEFTVAVLWLMPQVIVMVLLVMFAMPVFDVSGEMQAAGAAAWLPRTVSRTACLSPSSGTGCLRYGMFSRQTLRR